DSFHVQGAQALDQALQSLGNVLATVREAIQDVHVEPIFRDVNSHKLGHPNTLPCKCGLATSSGPSDCSGFRNKTDRVPAHPRPGRPEGGRTRGRPAGFTSFATLTTRSP